MSYNCSENIFAQESAGNFLRDELGCDVQFADNTEVLGEIGTFGRKSHREILRVSRRVQANIFQKPLGLNISSRISTLTEIRAFSSLIPRSWKSAYRTSCFDFAE